MMSNSISFFSGWPDPGLRLWGSNHSPVGCLLTGKEKAVLRKVILVVSTASAFLRTGRTLASGSNDKTIHMWDVPTGQEKSECCWDITESMFVVESFSYSPDGKTLASASFDETIPLWDVATGKEKASAEGAYL